MAIVVPQFELTQGSVHCLHLPRGKGADHAAFQILQRADQQSKHAIVAGVAMQRGAIRELFIKQSPAHWLANAGNLSKSEAEAVIESFPLKVHHPLACNGGSPRTFLGVAAALANEPDVLIYSSCGLDPVGREQLHQYIAWKARKLCVVHLSTFTTSGIDVPESRICPDTAQCKLIDAAPAGGAVLGLL